MTRNQQSLSQTQVKLSFIEAGSCTHVEGMIDPQSSHPLRVIRFPSSVAVIEHPSKGVILFDTGYSPRFFVETRSFPESLYAKITPVTVDESTSVLGQLRARGIAARDVTRVVLSHFHADHIAGLRDFTSAQFVYHQDAFSKLKNLGRLGRLRAGFLPGLLPADFEERSASLNESRFTRYESPLVGFERGCDLLLDGSLVVIPLPGHAAGHVGLLVRSDQGEKFLIADAAWSRRSIRENRMPFVATKLIMADFEAYRETLGRLNRLSRERMDIDLVPCHCSESV